jgi:Ser/Thr protein kinase RdoA (MazF antagonist)
VDLGAVMSSSYGIEVAEVVPTGGQTFEIVDTRGGRFMVRIGRGAPSMVDALGYLEVAGHVAPRVIPTVAGRALASPDGEDLVVLERIDGAVTPFTAKDLLEVGAALGRLHALGDPGSGMLRPAAMLPSNELAGVGMSAVLSAELDGEVAAYRDAVVAAAGPLGDDLSDCPHVLLHGDCHPWNSIRTGDGSVVLIDWDSSGRGAALVDLGFLLLSADLGPLTDPPIESESARVEAVVDGYAAHRLLGARELRRLPDAVRFRALVFVMGVLAEDLAAGRMPEPNGWWERCLAADEIALRAAARFRRHGMEPMYP